MCDLSVASHYLSHKCLSVAVFCLLKRVMQLPTACAVEGHFGRVTGAVNFGDNRHSHAEVDVHDEHINDKLDNTATVF